MAGELNGLSSMATRHLLAELADAYERQAGVRVAIVSTGGVEAARRVRDGEPTDVVVLAAGVVETLEAEGHLLAASRVALARSEIAVAVPAGRARPSVADGDAVRAAMLAGRVGYSTGPSGDHLKALWQRWGVADAMTPRAIQAPPGVPVATLLARGEVDLGIQQLSELLGQPGIDILGPLPPDIQAITIFTGAVAATSRQPEAARALLAFLASPDAAAAKRRCGMQPG